MLTSDRPAPDGSAERYGLAPGLLLRQWESGCAVIFHAAGNSTHLVDGRAAALLARLIAAPQPLTLETLLAAELAPAAPSAGGGDESASHDASGLAGTLDAEEPVPPAGLDVLHALLQAGLVIEVGG